MSNIHFVILLIEEYLDESFHPFFPGIWISKKSMSPKFGRPLVMDIVLNFASGYITRAGLWYTNLAQELNLVSSNVAA